MPWSLQLSVGRCFHTTSRSWDYARTRDIERTDEEEERDREQRGGERAMFIDSRIRPLHTEEGKQPGERVRASVCERERA